MQPYFVHCFGDWMTGPGMNAGWIFSLCLFVHCTNRLFLL